jgi:hypothetical protein
MQLNGLSLSQELAQLIFDLVSVNRCSRLVMIRVVFISAKDSKDMSQCLMTNGEVTLKKRVLAFNTIANKIISQERGKF